MARRYDHSSEQLKRMALDATRDIVAEHGFRELSTRKVASRIGYSVGTLYNHFENLDDLVLHLNAETLDALYEQLSQTPMTGVPETDVVALADAYYDFIDKHFSLWSAIFEHRLPEGQDLPDWYQPKVDRLLELVDERIAPLFPDGPREAIVGTSRLLWGAVHGLCILTRTDKMSLVSEQPGREMWPNLIGNYIAGLKAGRQNQG